MNNEFPNYLDEGLFFGVLLCWILLEVVLISGLH